MARARGGAYVRVHAQVRGRARGRVSERARARVRVRVRAHGHRRIRGQRTTCTRVCMCVCGRGYVCVHAQVRGRARGQVGVHVCVHVCGYVGVHMGMDAHVGKLWESCVKLWGSVRNKFRGHNAHAVGTTYTRCTCSTEKLTAKATHTYGVEATRRRYAATLTRAVQAQRRGRTHTHAHACTHMLPARR